MCLLCEDENSYAKYLEYLDALERAGREPDPDKAMDMLMDELQKSDAEKFKNKSPFICDAIDE
ncbi:MAG: hypothetical protein AB1342_15660 [Pseudomonadota bacterium]